MALFTMGRIVLRNLFSPPVTRRYPFREKESMRTPITRGRIAIDIAACTFCGACQKRCPTDAIVVTRAEKAWSIDRLRCCACNACVEVCPVKCLAMENLYSPATVTRDKDIFRREGSPPTAAR